jgi:uncharacterized protein with HEPN domain
MFLHQLRGAMRIVDFRNRLTYECQSVDDELVWGLAKGGLQILRVDCQALVSQLDAAG